MRKLAIVHFNPVELYPPALNWLNFLAEKSPKDLTVRVYTMYPPENFEAFISPSVNIRIIRAGRQLRSRALLRYLNYGIFYVAALWRILWQRPDTLLYFETNSAFPALMYKKYFNRKARLFIHYHEYVTIDEYQHGMKLSSWQHKLERNMYSLAEWISQTNEDRIRLFKEDLGNIPYTPISCLPNYPPASWYKGTSAMNQALPEAAADREGWTNRDHKTPLKIVCVGAIGLNTMYVKEFAEWVDAQHGAVVWDIYTSNIADDAKAYLSQIDNGWVRLLPAVNYFKLPEVLRKYDIGVILYNGFIPNHTFSVPNKLIEYYACGLDVWFPEKLTTSLPYVNQNVYPRIVSMDFTMLAAFDWHKETDRTTLQHQAVVYSCEDALDEIWNKLLSN